MKQHRKRTPIFLLLMALVLLLLSLWHYRNTQERPSLSALSQSLHQQLEESIAGVQQLAAHPLWDTLSTGVVPVQFRASWHKLPFGWYVAEGDSLVYWNRYDFLLPVLAGQQGDTLVQLKNGVYWQMSGQWPQQNRKWYALIPLVIDYTIDNAFLQQQTGLFQQLPEGVHWQQNAPENTSDGFQMPQGRGWLIANPANSPPGLFAIVCFVVAMLLILSALYLWGGHLARKQSPWAVFWVLTVILLVLRMVSLMHYPDIFHQFDLFSPRHYGASDLSPSLGDFIINLVLVFFLLLFWLRHVPLKPPANHLHQRLAGGAGLIILMGSGVYIITLIRTLVIDSNIVFQTNDFFQLDIYTFIGLTLLGLLMLIWWLLLWRIGPFLQRLALPRGTWLIIGAIVVLTVVGLALIAGWNIRHTVVVMLITLALLLLLRWLPLDLHQRPGFWYQVLWLVAMGLISAGWLHHLNQQKQESLRKLHARLLTQQDHLTEFMFSQVQPRMQEDAFLRGYFANPLLSKKQLEKRLNTLYFQDQLNRYQISIYTYLDDAIPYKNKTHIPLSDFFRQIDSSGRPSSVPNLYYFPESPDNLEYMAMVRVYSQPDQPISKHQVGRIVILFKIQSYGLSSVYPELLLSESVRSSLLPEYYDYALYLRNKLVKRKGGYPYKLVYRGDGGEDFTTIDDGAVHHLIYEEIPGRSVWLTYRQATWITPLSLFSYLFSYYLLLLLLGHLVYWLYRWANGYPLRLGWQQLTLRTRIQVFIVVLIAISFGLIGWLTISNIRAQYNEYHNERLLRKTRQILSGLAYQRKEMADTTDRWQPYLNTEQLSIDLANLSEIHAMDLNLYDNDGTLLVTSQPDIFRKGLIAPLMDPVAMWHLLQARKSQFIHHESIGALGFISAYIPLLNEDQQIEAILNLPYFAKEKNLREEINEFLVYFVNIYVLLFVLAGLMGVLFSNSVTRPLEVLGDKMKVVRLGSRNEPIRWRSQDEIGQLIDQYNKMIAQLEESAKLLKQSERESAWREMARQVAHEIKNPLTPMKLSIQLLQRAQLEGRSDLDERVARTADTLIEQIEQLSHIAGEFSAFAKIPPAKMEPLVINDLLRSVGDLFKNESVDLHMDVPQTPYTIMADKSQMIRVCNNLITNAIQAIPDDRKGEITIGLTATDHEITIRVEDNGVGIPPEQADKVFVPNFTTKSSGTGLGLAMTKKMVEFAKGKVAFTSEVGVGTTFFVTLPLFDEAKEST